MNATTAKTYAIFITDVRGNLAPIPVQGVIGLESAISIAKGAYTRFAICVCSGRYVVTPQSKANPVYAQ